MGIVTEKNSSPELTGLLNSMQAFSNSYLQKTNADTTFFYELMQDIKTLETLLAAINKEEDVTSDLIEFRKRIGRLIEHNDKEFDEKLLRQLNNYYLQDVKQTPLISIADKIKQLEKSKLYIPPTKTTIVHKFEIKFDEVLKFLNSNEHECHAKSQFITQALVELKTYINKMEASTEIVLTSIQANEMREIINLLEELRVLYDKEVEVEVSQEANYKKDIAELPQASVQWLKKLNSLTQWYMDHAKYDAAEKNVHHAITEVEKIEDKEFIPPKAKAWELYASSQVKRNQHTEAKNAYKEAAALLKQMPEYAEYVATLEAHAKKAEAQEFSIVLTHDKDIENLKRMQIILQKSGDVHLAHIASKGLSDLYNKLTDAEIAPTTKIQLLNEFIDRWHKYTDHRGESFTKPEWYTPEMEQIISNDLFATLRMIRETFAAKTASPIAMVAAKEKAASEAQIRAAEIAKAKRAEMRAQAEAEKLRAQAEVSSKLQAVEDAAKAQVRAAEQARSEEMALIQNKMRMEALVSVRKSIAKLMREAKDALIRAEIHQDNKEHLQEEETKLREVVELFSKFRTQEYTVADLSAYAKSLARLGLALRNQGHLNSAEEYFMRAISVYNDLNKKENFRNVASVNMKVEVLADLARSYYMQRKYFEAEKNFDAALADIDNMLAQPYLDESFKGLFKELKSQNKGRALLMAKMLSAEEVDGIKELPNKDNMIETLYHASALRQKCDEEERKLVHHLLNLDKSLTDKSERVQQLYEIMVRIERPLLKKVILLGEILKVQDEDLDVLDRNILKVYNEDLISLAFVEVLNQSSEILPKELQPFISEIKSIRNELRMGQDVKLAALGLNLEQKIIYLLYEKHLAEKDHITVPNLDMLFRNYLTQYINPTEGVEKVKSKRKWLGRVLSALRKKKSR